jgi:hypothetical protein
MTSDTDKDLSTNAPSLNAKPSHVTQISCSSIASADGFQLYSAS